MMNEPPNDGETYTDEHGKTWVWVAHDYAHIPTATPGHWTPK